MGLLGGLMGNASKVDVGRVQQELAGVLAQGEAIEHAYQLVRDYFVFTNHRVISVDKQGLTGKKVDIHSYPYRSITHFSVETAGTFDLDAELKLWVSSKPDPVCRQFSKGVSVLEVQAILASYVLR